MIMVIMIISFPKRLLTNQASQTKGTESAHVTTTSSTPWKIPSWLNLSFDTAVRNKFFFHPLLQLIESVCGLTYLGDVEGLSCVAFASLVRHIWPAVVQVRASVRHSATVPFCFARHQWFTGELSFLHLSVSPSSWKWWRMVRMETWWFLFCQLFGPVNRPENWKSWERRGEKLDYQALQHINLDTHPCISPVSVSRRSWHIVTVSVSDIAPVDTVSDTEEYLEIFRGDPEIGRPETQTMQNE